VPSWAFYLYTVATLSAIPAVVQTEVQTQAAAAAAACIRRCPSSCLCRS